MSAANVAAVATQSRLWLAHLKRSPLLVFVLLYTIVSGGPFLWVAVMSLRTTPEISANPYVLPFPLHFEKFARPAWTKSNYGTYFWNSTIVVVTAVALITIIGAMLAHALARFSLPWQPPGYRFVILSGMILPPQLLILSLFQILVELRRLYNTLTGLIMVCVAGHLAMTVYILEGFFAQIPQDLFDAARAWTATRDLKSLWRITLPIGTPALFTTVTLNFIILWNEFLYAVVLMTDDDKRTLPLGIMHVMGSHQLDIGMLATGLMIAIGPIILLYGFFSEIMIKGMTAGAVR